MNVLGQIRVSEAYGIRRFLYPLSAEISLPDPNLTSSLGLATRDGRLLPLQVTPSHTSNSIPTSRLDFAASLEPLETLDLLILTEQPATTVDDPLHIKQGKRLRNTQRRFSMEFDQQGTIHDVLYDAVAHLRGPSAVLRNGEQATLDAPSTLVEGFPLNARLLAEGTYADGCRAETHLEITACKSWVKLNHLLAQPQPGDELVFLLPMATSSSVITCDFGVGGSLYGNLPTKGDAEVHWQNKFLPTGEVHWSVAVGDRIDYVGAVEPGGDYQRQCWFHQIDGSKALAVAITEIPACCKTMDVGLRSNGDVAIAFQLAESACERAVFGLCYHFLNDIPAIAAATNPQSILLPPRVKLMPAA